MGKHSKAFAKNHYKEKQALTYAEHQLPSGQVLIIPDTGNAYGDEVSAARMSEDYVGLKTGDDGQAKAAGESARAQFNVSTKERLMAIRAQQYFSKYASAGMYVVRDNAGVVTGVEVLLRRIDTDTEEDKITSKFIPIDMLERAAR